MEKHNFLLFIRKEAFEGKQSAERSISLRRWRGGGDAHAWVESGGLSHLKMCRGCLLRMRRLMRSGDAHAQ